ncbi:hypothetical protein EG68_07857 [Paragonimus skrjabini miyazakii]|uniref:Uncharacterized protein n=1 Tax=Paragonimus skrjabini miyazakii TaxID=59628 RepID=A0A8S9YJE1_9TREM|nr:hypothetical protein EG68_07857 [Paragonimus skrjabini miyazakii]
MSQLGGTSEGGPLRDTLSRNIYGDWVNSINISGLKGKHALKGTRLYMCMERGFHQWPPVEYRCLSALQISA